MTIFSAFKERRLLQVGLACANASSLSFGQSLRHSFLVIHSILTQSHPTQEADAVSKLIVYRFNHNRFTSLGEQSHPTSRLYHVDAYYCRDRPERAELHLPARGFGRGERQRNHQQCVPSHQYATQY